MLVDSDVALKEAHRVLETAYVCGIDAEWDPNVSKPYAASLVQIAVRCQNGREYAIIMVSSRISSLTET
jgi:hypothetical protein